MGPNFSPNPADRQSAAATPATLDDLRRDVEAKHGMKLDDGVVAAVVELGRCYHEISQRFEAAGINAIEPGSGNTYPLSDEQQRVFDAEMPALSEQIELRSQALARAAAALPRNLDLPLSEDKVRAAHADFTKAALQPELFQSAFGNWLTNQIGGQQGGVVSIAILLNDPFLRHVISQMPALTELAKTNPLFPTTLAGKVVEESLLTVPVARDHHARLADLAILKETLVRNALRDGKDLPILSNIACGTASEDAAMLARIDRAVDLSGLVLHLLDQNPGALQIARARISQSLGDRGANAPHVFSGTIDITQLDASGARAQLPSADLAVAAGIADYLTFEQRRTLLLAMALSLRENGMGVMTKVLHHPHEHQQELILGWRLKYDTVETMERLAQTLKSDLDTLRASDPSIPAFSANFRSDIENERVLFEKPDLLKPGEFAVVKTADGTNASLVFKLGA